MNKQKFHIKLNNESFNTLGEFSENTLVYYESNKLRSKMTINLDTKKIEKDNIDYKIDLDLSKSIGIINLKKEKGSFNLKLKLNKFNINDKKIEINYIIEDSKEEINLEIEGDFR